MLLNRESLFCVTSFEWSYSFFEVDKLLSLKEWLYLRIGCIPVDRTEGRCGPFSAASERNTWLLLSIGLLFLSKGVGGFMVLRLFLSISPPSLLLSVFSFPITSPLLELLLGLYRTSGTFRYCSDTCLASLFLMWWWCSKSGRTNHSKAMLCVKLSLYIMSLNSLLKYP